MSAGIQFAGMSPDCGLEVPGTWFDSRGKNQSFFSSNTVYTGSRADPATYSMDTGFSLGDKAAGTWNCPPIPSAKVTNA